MWMMMTNQKLRKPLSIRNAKIEIDAVSFQTDLALAYNSFGYYASLINKTCNFYEQVSYLHNAQNNEIPLNLNTNDVVMIQVADYGESYAIVKGIFKHKSNDGYYYSFIYVNWFEDIH
ncbi:2006_t:CDS:2 [Funneliformis geosporum]|nr:2006_t:CDS:2 [Funneliformis geosporum]